MYYTLWCKNTSNKSYKPFNFLCRNPFKTLLRNYRKSHELARARKANFLSSIVSFINGNNQKQSRKPVIFAPICADFNSST